MELENARAASATRTREYIDDVQAEMRRVTWPTWPQVRVDYAGSDHCRRFCFRCVTLAWWTQIVNAVITKIINFFHASRS